VAGARGGQACDHATQFVDGGWIDEVRPERRANQLAEDGFATLARAGARHRGHHHGQIAAWAG
jgi:hypothetical protein